MFDSDSQSEQNFKLGKVAQQDQPQVKQILQKGKKILPNYDDQALHGLYKRYYSVQHIFLNELNMIAKRLKGDQDNDDNKKKNEKWIKVGREVKTKVNKTKYNFLEDKQLLRRAQQYLKNKKVLPERRQFNNDQGQNNRTNGYKPVRKQQSHNQSFQDRKPKQKFVQKVQDNKVENTQQQKPVQTTKKVEPSPVKEQKYKQKVEAPAPQTKTQQQAPKFEEKKPVTQEKTQPVKASEAPKKQEPKKEEPVKVTQPVQQPPKQVEPVSKPVEQKPVQKQQPVVQAPKQATQQLKQTQSIPSSHSIPTVQNYDPVLATKNFEQACNQNSFVLKFIQPQAYTQRISYIRTGDGGMKNVQIRVTGTSNQGSQKAL